MKRILFIADMHCGHRAGLTPPEYWYNPADEDPEVQKFLEVQKILWDFYERHIVALQPIHTVVVVGDSVDGKGQGSGGTELLTTDRLKQAEIAARCIKLADASHVLMVHGTGYHVGTDEDFESVVAEKVGARIKDKLWLDVSGLTFEIRHQVGRSTIPHGRYTAVAREALWEDLWAIEEERRPADIVVRAHQHYYVKIEDVRREAVILPCLCGYSKFGVRRSTGLVNIGFLSIDVETRERYTWKKHFLRAKSLKSKPLSL